MLNQLVEQHVEEHPLLIGKEKPFAINAGFTPYAMDYFVGDRINHSQWGKGMVIASGIVEGRTAYEQARRERWWGPYQPLHYTIRVVFDNPPEGAMNVVEPNIVELLVMPAEHPNPATLLAPRTRHSSQAQSFPPG